MDAPLSDVVATGNRRSSLEAIRDRLAAELMESTGAGAAAVSRELRAVMDEIERLPGGQEVDPVDELAAKRARRIANATGR